MGGGVVTVWLVVGAGCLFIGLGLDLGAASTMAVAQQHEDTYFTYWGLFKVCNGSREVTRREKLEIWRDEPECVFPTSLDEQWIPVSLGMELAALAFGLASVVIAVILLVLLKVNWLRSRTALVALIPIACIAGFFNTIGAVVMSVNLGDIVSWSLHMDAAAAAFYLAGALCAALDLQACCSRHTSVPGMGRGLLRPI